MAEEDNTEHEWGIRRKHVGAVELGTTSPWIPEMLKVTAKYYGLSKDGSNLVEFKDSTNAVVYAIDKNSVREIFRLDAQHAIEEIPWPPEGPQETS